jgi:hypothetical protein
MVADATMPSIITKSLNTNIRFEFWLTGRKSKRQADDESLPHVSPPANLNFGNHTSMRCLVNVRA